MRYHYVKHVKTIAPTVHVIPKAESLLNLFAISQRSDANCTSIWINYKQKYPHLIVIH